MKETENLDSSGKGNPKKTPMLNGGEVYTLSKFRWILWVWFMIQQIGFGIGTVSYTTISPLLKDLYGRSNIEVSLLVLWFTIFFIPINFPANLLVEKYGISIPIRLGSTLLIIGAALRLLLHNGFYYILAGQWIMAMGLPFWQTLGAKIASLWFGDHERAFATTISSIAIIFGVVIGFAFPNFFLSDSDKDNPDAKDKLWLYTLIQTIVEWVLAVPAFILVQNKPKDPPSKSAKQVIKNKNVNMMKSLKELIKMSNYWLITISFSFIYSIYIVLGASVGALCDAFNYDSGSASIFGGIFIIFGLVGSIVNAIINLYWLW